MDMGPAAILLGVAFPVLIGIGVALAVADSNESEFWIARICFILAGIDAVGITVVWLWLGERVINWKTFVGAAIAAIALILLVSGLQWIDYKEEKILTKLFPGTKPTPVAPENCNIPDDAIAVFFGSNVAWRTYPFTILDLSDIKMLSVNKIQNHTWLVIDILRIFDDHGNIIVKIDPDGFWIDPGIQRKKPDRSTLLVYDRNDDEVLRIEFLNPRALSVQGIFRDRTGATVRITSDALLSSSGGRLRQGCFGGVDAAIKIN
jgi:hypothetical protein